jgi:cytosine deaminase
MPNNPDYAAMLQEALVEARLGLAEGGIPIGAALFDASGRLVGRGRNRRVQDLPPGWYCCGLVQQVKIGTVVLGESRTFKGGIDWLRRQGVKVVDMKNAECEELLGRFIKAHPEIWNEDIGE